MVHIKQNIHSREIDQLQLGKFNQHKFHPKSKINNGIQIVKKF